MPAMQEERSITEDEFVAQFKPVLDPEEDGDWLKLDDWHDPEQWARIRAAADARTLWTCVDTASGAWALLSGLHYMDRIYYIISENPVPADVLIDVYDPNEPPRCPECCAIVEGCVGSCHICETTLPAAITT